MFQFYRSIDFVEEKSPNRFKISEKLGLGTNTNINKHHLLLMVQKSRKNLLRLVVYQCIIYKVLYIPGG